jgi:hypothetical protein
MCSEHQNNNEIIIPTGIPALPHVANTMTHPYRKLMRMRGLNDRNAYPSSQLHYSSPLPEPDYQIDRSSVPVQGQPRLKPIAKDLTCWAS